MTYTQRILHTQFRQETAEEYRTGIWQRQTQERQSQWLQSRPRAGKRGPRPGLSADAIVDAAIRLADAEGLEGVSMARVAAELGFTPMSLYRYVASKEELLQLMWNGSARGAEDLVFEGDGWRA